MPRGSWCHGTPFFPVFMYRLSDLPDFHDMSPAPPPAVDVIALIAPDRSEPEGDTSDDASIDIKSRMSWVSSSCIHCRILKKSEKLIPSDSLTHTIFGVHFLY